MLHSRLMLPAPPQPELETAIGVVEGRLAALAEALRQRDMPEVDRRASELHRALADAVSHFGHAARKGQVAPALRTRLATAGAVVAAQRESLARATAALDRAIDVLLPRETPTALYDAAGIAARAPRRAGAVA